MDAKQKYEQIIQRADMLRKKPTKHETILLNALSSDEEISRYLRFQHVIFPFIADFAFLDATLIVEVDGNIHEKIRNSDDIREEELIKAGWKIIRVSNTDIENNLNHCLQQIKFEYIFRKQNMKAIDRKPHRKTKKKRKMVFVLPKVVYEEPAVTYEIRRAGRVYRRWVKPNKPSSGNMSRLRSKGSPSESPVITCHICKLEIRNYESRVRFRIENESSLLWIHKGCRGK